MEESFKTRLTKEAEELHDKIVKLGAFLGTEAFKKLPQIQKSLLTAQHPAMQAYWNILAERIKNLT